MYKKIYKTLCEWKWWMGMTKIPFLVPLLIRTTYIHVRRYVGLFINRHKKSLSHIFSRQLRVLWGTLQYGQEYLANNKNFHIMAFRGITSLWIHSPWSFSPFSQSDKLISLWQSPYLPVWLKKLNQFISERSLFWAWSIQMELWLPPKQWLPVLYEGGLTSRFGGKSWGSSRGWCHLATLWLPQISSPPSKIHPWPRLVDNFSSEVKCYKWKWSSMWFRSGRENYELILMLKNEVDNPGQSKGVRCNL